MVSITLALSAVLVRLAWEVTTTTEVGSMVIIVLLILVILSIYALSLYLTIKPSQKKASSLPVRIWITVIITTGLIGGIVHFVRFVPSPEAAAPLSVIIASLLLTGGISAYLLVLWMIWFVCKGRIV
jgi:hypothetical protein